MMNQKKQNKILDRMSDEDIIFMTGVTKVGLRNAFKKYKRRHTVVRRLVYLNNPRLYYSQEVFKRD